MSILERIPFRPLSPAPRDGKPVLDADDKLLQAEIAKYGRFIEPEIAREHLRARERERQQPVGTLGSYLTDHPTHFNWRPDVRAAVNRVQSKFPYLTYANTYTWHPPYDPPAITRRYDAVSVDFWGGGVVNGRYVGYRGKDINLTVNGWRVFNALWYDPNPPNIWWIIYNGRIWIRGRGWSSAPWGPPDSDAGHYRHIHCTFV